MAEIMSQQKLDWAVDHLSPMILNNQLQYHLWVDAEIIFRYQEVLFDIPKLLWDDTRSYNITDGWMLTSPLKIKRCIMIFLHLTKLPQEQKLAQNLYHSTYFIVRISLFGSWCLEHVISIFLPRLREIRLRYFGLLVIHRIVYFGVVFDLVFQICINYCTYVFSNPNRSLFKFLAVFFSVQWFNM